jgi:hypothetical protein
MDDAREAGCTPVYADWCASYSLDAAGRPITSANGSWRDGEVVRDPVLRNCILAQASIRYPELAYIRPVRGADDPPCKSCGGTGKLQVAADVICPCGGLGWVPVGAPQADETAKLASDAARALGLTLVSSDFCEDYALDPEGNPVKAMWADWRNAERVHDPVLRNRILVEASVRCPEWAHVRPVRGDGDKTCLSCDGDPTPSGWAMCYCGGLGWLPAGAPQAPGAAVRSARRQTAEARDRKV